MTKSTIIWEDLYNDLAPRIAKSLRNARIKPEKLATMSDGEITSLEGIGEVALEEIRAKYPLNLDKTLKPSDNTPTAKAQPENTSSKRKPKHPQRGGKKITAMAKKVDRLKLYELAEAIKLIKETNITKFDATLTLHLNLKNKLGRIEVTFPHQAGKAKIIAIANDEVLAEIKKGVFNFDMLLATPAMMPKLAKFARVLGPKGLMPSPKAGTVTPNPEAKKKEFAGGKTMIKSENKFPLMHVTIGKLSQKDEELIANIQAVLDAVQLKNITKATLASTMSPGVKLNLS